MNNDNQGEAAPTQHRCKCGVPLSKVVFYRTSKYAASLEDLQAHRQNRLTVHDVLSGTGRTLRIGICQIKGFVVDQDELQTVLGIWSTNDPVSVPDLDSECEQRDADV